VRWHLTVCTACAEAVKQEMELRQVIAPTALPRPSVNFEQQLRSKLNLIPQSKYNFLPGLKRLVQRIWAPDEILVYYISGLAVLIPALAWIGKRGETIGDWIWTKIGGLYAAMAAEYAGQPLRIRGFDFESGLSILSWHNLQSLFSTQIILAGIVFICMASVVGWISNKY